ncbi:MAG: C40 family peptidase [Clostridia bacterium]|nr:C40 family peptidase [Clostridia bacterium]
MKRLLAFVLCMLLLTVTLCACGANTDGELTVITKASVSYSLQTTTTVARPTTTVYTGIGTTQGSTVSTGTTTLPTVAADGATTELGNRIAQTAISLIGTPYASGASGPDAFDNPGFVSYCYKQAGFTVARRASAMLTFGVEAPLHALQPGDILLFCNELGGEAQFVAIYIGGDQFVACNNPESPTKAQKLDNKYWLPRLLAARRAE